MTATTTTVSSAEDIIDVRDVIDHFEELASRAALESDEVDELGQLTALLADLKGNGGDEQWRGDWYPIGLVRDSYFQEYAEQLAEDIGAVNTDATWPNNHIDWERAASDLQQDYSTVEFDGVTFWYR